MALCIMIAVTACKREEREWRTDPPVGAALDQVKPMPNRINGSNPLVLAALGRPYEGNAYQISQGKRLYAWFNCQGCHADGGGDSGPALMDGWWRYGPDRVSIHATIRDGRPNGMPSFRNKIPDDQIWELAAFVRSLSGNAPSSAAPQRNDELMPHPSENRMPDAATLGKSP